MGPALLVALLGLVLALIQRSHADKILAAFVLAYFATLLPLDAHFDRYVLPLVPRSARSPGVCERWPGDLAPARHPARLVDRRRPRVGEDGYAGRRTTGWRRT